MKRGRATNSKGEYVSEMRGHVLRFYPDGKEYKYVEKLADNFFIPFLTFLSGIPLPKPAADRMDEYRPLENNIEVPMKEHMRSLKRYREMLLKREANTTDTPNPIDTPTLKFINGHTVTQIKPVMIYLFKRNDEELPKGKLLKKDIMDHIILRLQPPTNSVDQIDEFRNICIEKLDRPFIPKFRTEKNTTPSAKVRLFKEVLLNSPDENLCESMVNDIVWNKSLIFPLPKP